MLQTLLWRRMTCSSTFLKYPLAVLAQTPATYILMYCNAFLSTFTAARCFQLRKKVLRLDATSYQSSDRTIQHLCLWLQNEHGWQFCKQFAPHPGGTNDNDTHACEPNYSTVQNKIIAKILPWINLQLWNFCHSFLQWMGSFFLDYYVLLWNTCLYRSVCRHGYHCHSSPLAEARIPRRAAARAHFLVVDKSAGQFYLSFDTR